ncbi:MAG: methyltransferase domain-containing protein [Candidatus Aminicenantes bacterium]|nr:methyltransferase domain-containing protein [Candidatus Aminicenantes bacterium]
MKERRLDLIILIGLVVLAIAGVVVFRPSRLADEAIAPLPPAGETTFRNLTRVDLALTVRLNLSQETPENRLLRANALDKIRTDHALEVTYPRDGATVFFITTPGHHYSFRYDEEDRVQVYPGSHGREDAADLAPYVPTPMPVVERMLELASLSPDDVLYDLGSGDGRIVITAARKFGCRAVGIDIDPDMVRMGRLTARREGVASRIRFICADVTKSDLRKATVVTMYLLPESNELLAPILEKQLRPGARVVTHDYSMPGWEDRLLRWERVPGEDGPEHTVYAYRK